MINEYFNITNIALEMELHYPSKKTNHREIAANYLRQVQFELQKGILRCTKQQLEDGLIPVSWDQLRKECGVYGSRGKTRNWWFNWFQSHHPLLEKIKTGYSFGNEGTLTMVKSIIDLEILLSTKDPAETFAALYKDVDSTTEFDWADIDLRSLGNYIKSNEGTIARSKRGEAVIKHNLITARAIYDIATYTGGKLPQIVKESNFGRRYYRGINLQNASKIVRHAALGKCHQYDIEASVFTWKYDTAKSINPDIRLPATLEYLDFKDKHRERLAKLTFGNDWEVSKKTIKNVITAVGFGARATNVAYVKKNGVWEQLALSKMITSNEKLKTLLSDPWFKEFIEEQDNINSLIFNEIKTYRAIANNSELLNAKFALSRNKTISWAYQQCERQIIEKLWEIAEPKGILLKCHDGFYTRNRVNPADLKFALQEMMPSGRLDHEIIEPYSFQEFQDVEDHKNLIREQELKANNGFIPPQVFANYSRIETKHYSYDYNSEGFDNGNRQESFYDPELDPFYMEEEL
jgi:hypothetical protein